jgi:hypothetical protein
MAALISSWDRGISMDSPIWLGSSGSAASAFAWKRKKAIIDIPSSNLWYLISTCPGIDALFKSKNPHLFLG